MPKDGRLYYKGRSVNRAIFKVGRKDLRCLVGYCVRCGRRLVGTAAIPGPDPYASDIRGDHTPVVECEPVPNNPTTRPNEQRQR